MVELLYFVLAAYGMLQSTHWTLPWEPKFGHIICHEYVVWGLWFKNRTQNIRRL